MKKWSKALSVAMLSVLCLGAIPAAPAMAAYQLNPEVKDATPALKEAAEIGVRVYNNPNMQNVANRDAMVIMSFGTTYKDSREKTINPTVAAIQKALPNVKVVTAYTSHIIVDRIKANEGLTIPTPEQALEQLKKEGYTRVALATLDVIPGMEYNYDTASYRLYRNQFKKMTLGLPLLYWQGQKGQRDDVMDAMKAFETQFPKTGKEDAVLVMAHGTPDPSNAYYSVVQTRLDRLGKGNAHIYTVEGWPNLEDVIPMLKEKGIKNVTLMPMMMVAGDHANNDMAGDEEDSHKNILKKNGFNVNTYIHGLGENKAIRQLFVNRALESWQYLEGNQETAHAGMKR
jgi:sirohydrochlorin cobaltochelatase